MLADSLGASLSASICSGSTGAGVGKGLLIDCPQAGQNKLVAATRSPHREQGNGGVTAVASKRLISRRVQGTAGGFTATPRVVNTRINQQGSHGWLQDNRDTIS